MPFMGRPINFATGCQLKINKRKTLLVCEVHFKYQNLNYKTQNDGVQTAVGNKHFAKDSFKPAGNKSEICFFVVFLFQV